MAATIQVPTVFTAKDNFSSRVRKMTAQSTMFGRSLSYISRMNMSLNRSFGKLTSTLGRFGLVLGITAVFGVVSNGIGIIADFEQANANLASVMSSATNPELISLRKNSEYLGASTAKTATEVVGLQESLARLGFETPEILNMTSGVISGSISMRGELSETAEMVGALIRTFDKFSSLDTSDIIDKITLATQKSALNFEKLQTSLPIVAGAANAAGIPFETLLGLLGKLSDAGIDASMSSTALRNIFIESKAKGLEYNKILELIAKSSDKLTSSVDAFGVRSAVSGAILANKLQEVSELTKTLENDFKGVADTAIRKQLDTLTGRFTLLKSAYDGFILSMDNGQGAFSENIKLILETTTHMLSLMSGTAVATSELTEHHKVVRGYAEDAIKLIKVLGYFVAALIAFKVVAFVASVIEIALAGISAAMTLFSVVSAVATATGTSFAAVLWAITWPILAVVAAIAAIIAVFIYWDEITNWLIESYNKWGAAIISLLGPLGAIINVVIGIAKHWDMIKDSFSNGGIISGIKAIGIVILDALLMPVQQLLELLSNIPGLGDLSGGASFIQDIRHRLLPDEESGLNVTDDVLTPDQRTSERIERTFTQNFLNIGINNNSGFNIETEQGGGMNIPIMLQNTMTP